MTVYFIIPRVITKSPSVSQNEQGSARYVNGCLLFQSEATASHITGSAPSMKCNDEVCPHEIKRSEKELCGEV